MFKKTSAELKPLTQQFAAEFYNLGKIPGERGLKPARLKKILDKIREGRFYSPNWALGLCRRDSRQYHLNGQHGSYQLSHLPSDIRFPEGLNVTVDQWEFDSIEEDGLELFDMYDSPDSVRNSIDAIGMYRANHPDLEDLDREYLFSLSAGLNAYDAQLPEGFHNVGARKRGMLYDNPTYREFARWGSAFLNMKNHKLLGKPGVVAEMLTDYLDNQETATEFWGFTFAENHPDVDHESRELAEQLRTMSLRKRVTPDAYQKLARKMWRRFKLRHQAERQPVLPSEVQPRGESAGASA